jgi:peroxiredoxin Q/BCP
MSPDPPEDLKLFRDKYKLGFTLLGDVGHTALEAYGVWGDHPGRGPGVTRSTVLLSRDWIVERVWYGVSPDGHAQEVLAALESA